MHIKVKYLKSGWEDPDFERKLQRAIDVEDHHSYYDIKISSKGNHSMIILKSNEGK